jgi:hypothetical protein
VALVSRNKLLHASVKEVCRLWVQPCFNTFHQFLIIVEALWSQPILQVGKEIVVARSEIWAVRMVLKQLPVEILQQWSNESSCTRNRTRIVMDEHYTVCQHSVHFVQNGPMKLFSASDVIVVPCYMNSTITTPFLSQKTVCRVSGREGLLNFFGLFGECVRIHCFDWSLASAFTNETHVSSPVTVRCDRESHNQLYRSLRFVHTRQNFRNSCCAKVVIV